jgi:PAS domain-containing protein
VDEQPGLKVTSMEQAVSRLFDATLFEHPRDALSFVQAVLESSTEYSIIGKSPDGTIVLWNEGARRIYGWTPDEIIGVSADVLHHADDVPGDLSGGVARARSPGPAGGLPARRAGPGAG